MLFVLFVLVLCVVCSSRLIICVVVRLGNVWCSSVVVLVICGVVKFVFEMMVINCWLLVVVIWI